MEYVLDMQGFKKPGNDFVLKELAFVRLDTAAPDPVLLLFKAPFPWCKLTEKYRRENLWLELCYHGLTWHSGHRDYTEVGNILRENLQDAARIFVNGEIRKKWLERFNLKVSDITEWGYPPLELPTLATACEHHNGAYKAMCALHNVKLMKQFYFDVSLMDWEDIPSDRL